MDKRAQIRNTHHDPAQRTLDYLRKRSLHRVWWSSARVAMRRGPVGEPQVKPSGHRATGKPT